MEVRVDAARSPVAAATDPGRSRAGGRSTPGAAERRRVRNRCQRGLRQRDRRCGARFQGAPWALCRRGVWTELLDRLVGSTMTTLDGRGPAWLGIGAQRSGTTWFTDLLIQHPNVALGTNGKKEQHRLHRVAVGLRRRGFVLAAVPPGPTAGRVDSDIPSDPLDPDDCVASVPRTMRRSWCSCGTRRTIRFRNAAPEHPWQALTTDVAVPYHQWMGMYAEQLGGVGSGGRPGSNGRPGIRGGCRDPQSACDTVWRRLGLTPVELRNVEAASRTSTGEAEWNWPEGLRDGLTALYKPQVERLRDDWGVEVHRWQSFV